MLFDEPCSYEVANKRNSTTPLNLFRGSAYTNLFSFMPLLYRSCLIYSLEIKKDSLTRKYSFAFGVAGNRKKRSINSNMIFHIANYNLFEDRTDSWVRCYHCYLYGYKLKKYCRALPLRTLPKTTLWKYMNIDYFFSIYLFIFLPSLSILFLHVSF
jgi:hypothetical protein